MRFVLRVAGSHAARLAETLLPLLAEDQEAAVETANEALGKFAGRFEAAYAAGLRRKLGLFQKRQDDGALAQDLIDRMAGNGADFTLAFRRLSGAPRGSHCEPARCRRSITSGSLGSVGVQ